MTTLTCALCDAPAIACDNQLEAIQALRQVIHRCSQLKLPLSKVPQVTPPMITHTRRRSVLHPMCRKETVQPHASLPRVVIQTLNAAPSAPMVPSNKEQYDPVARRTRSKLPHYADPPPPRVDKEIDLGPIARRTRSQTTAMANFITPSQAAKRQYPAQFIQSMELPVINETSGKLLQYRQLCKHLKFTHIWNTSYANELGRLHQGVGEVSKGLKNQRVEGTNDFCIIRFEDTPQDRRKEICYSMVVCEVRPQQ